MVDRLLGKGVIRLSNYADGNSHYIWLEMPLLKKRRRRKVRKDIEEDSFDDIVNPEVNIRIQWMKESAVSRIQYSGVDSNVSVSINMMSIGIAFVDFNPFLGPRELIFALIDKIHATVNSADTEFQATFSVSSVQVDNQLPYANNPVILAPTALRLKHPSLPPKSMTNRMTDRKIGFFHGQLTLVNKEKSMIHIKELLLYVGEMDISVEEYLVDTLIAFTFDALPFLSGFDSDSIKHRDEDWKTYVLQNSLHFPDERHLLLNADRIENYMVQISDSNDKDKTTEGRLLGATNSRSVSSFSSSNNILNTKPRKALLGLLQFMNDQEYTSSLISGQSGSWFYFEYSEISAIIVNLTLTLGAKPKRAPVVDKYIASYTTAYGFQLVELDDVTISICGLMFEDSLMSRTHLIRLTTRHLTWEIIRMAHKILSSVPLVGIPVEAASNLTSAASRVVRPSNKKKVSSDVSDDIYDSYGEGFLSATAVQCNAIGSSMSASILRVIQAFSAVFLKASFRILGFGSECFALLSLDQEFIALLQRKPSSTKEAFYMGIREFGIGIGQGTVGLFMLPYQGSIDENDNCLRGLGVGFLGLVTKPISGILQCGSRSCFAAGRSIESINNDRIRSSNILGTRTRDPLRFINGNALPIDHDADTKEAEKRYWASALGGIYDRKYRKDRLLDIGHVDGPPLSGFVDSDIKFSNVLLFTQNRILKITHHHNEEEEDDSAETYYKNSRHYDTVRWAIRMKHIERIKVEPAELRILVYAQRVNMSGFGATLLCNSVLTCYEAPINLIMDTRDHFGEIYRLFLYHAQEKLDEASILLTIDDHGSALNSVKIQNDDPSNQDVTPQVYSIMG